jgi:hypothetical protein
VHTNRQFSCADAQRNQPSGKRNQLCDGGRQMLDRSSDGMKNMFASAGGNSERTNATA